MPNIFEVNFEDIERLDDKQLTDLLCRLLYLEANSFNIPSSCVYGSLKINVADGGEDARIKWQEGVEKTDWIPNRFTLFQCKATNMSPAECKKEIIKNNSIKLKGRVEEVFDVGGSYILFYNKSCNTNLKERRINKFREAIKEAGKDYAENVDIKIYDADQIARWTNQYVQAIIQVKSWLGKMLPNGIETWNQWAGYYDNKFDYVLSDELQSYIRQLRDYFVESKRVARIVGLSGLGKTRLALETFRPPENSEENIEQEIRNKSIVYLDASSGFAGLPNLITRWRNEGCSGIIIVDNCDIELHKKLKEKVEHSNSSLSLLTLDYSFEQTSDYDPYIELEPLPNKTIEKMLKQKYSGLLDMDISRIVEFAQGFPQMAVLLAEARLNEEPNIGNLKDDVIVNKLLWGRDRENRDYYSVISACSLFDYFGIEKEFIEQRQFIANKICNIDNQLCYEAIQYFINKGILDKRGRFVKVTPKPLAIRLAADWWKNCSPERAKNILTETMPDGMQERLCDQISKLHFLPKARNLVSDLCEEQSPFGKAEVLNTEKGSRLFRSLVEVNPNATVKALKNVFGNCKKEELLEIRSGRRNLIWSLEKLCFWEDTFPIAAEIMLDFAIAENESWGNNATNQFLQLFNTFLSGTQAPPKLRFEILDKALSKDNEYKIIAIKALGNVIKTSYFSRMGGVESQGSRAPEKDWKPNKWEEAFSYWREGLNRLSSIACEEGEIGELAREQIVKNIRGLVWYGRMDEIELSLTKIIKNRNIFWIEAYKKIQDTIKYEGNKISEEGKKQLEKWLKMLRPKSMSELLKLIVSKPLWLDDENQNKLYNSMDDFVQECLNKISDLIDNLEVVFKGEQRKGYKFGFILGKKLDNPKLFIDTSISILRRINNTEVNVSVLGGYLAAIRNKFPSLFTNTLERIYKDDNIYIHSIEIIRLTKPTLKELKLLIDIVKNRRIDIDKLESFKYGSILDHEPEENIMFFIEQVLSISEEALPIAFNIIYMYCYKNQDRFEMCKKQIRNIVLTSGLLTEKKLFNKLDSYNWRQTVTLLLENGEKDSELAEHIAKEIIKMCSDQDLSSSIKKRYDIKPIIEVLLRNYREQTWIIFSNIILSDNKLSKYRLKDLLTSHNNENNSDFSITSVLEKDFLVQWCNNYPDKAPVELSTIIDVIEEDDDENYCFTPIAQFLINNYGSNDKVLSRIYSNLRTGTWVGSMIPYLEKIKFVIGKLLDHDNINVRKWAREINNYLEKEIQKEKQKEDEESLGIY